MSRDDEIMQEASSRYPNLSALKTGFLLGAVWADSTPSTETINRIISLYKRWYSEQCDISMVDYIQQQYKQQAT